MIRVELARSWSVASEHGPRCRSKNGGRKYGLVLLLTLGAIQQAFVLADETSKAAPAKELILPGESFLVADRPAFILWPDEAKRQQPQPWVWYAPTLPGLPDRHEKWMHEQFLAAGVAVAGIDVGESYGSPNGQKLYTALYNDLINERGFSDEPCLLCRSRGGLMLSSWAIANADKVAGLAGIYPVFDLRSYPGIDRAASAYGLSPDELRQSLDVYNPVSRVDSLARSRVPAFLIHGDVDTVVPLEQNSQALVAAYTQVGQEELTTLIVPPGQGHNFWPGFFRCQELIDFAIERSRGGANHQ